MANPNMPHNGEQQMGIFDKVCVGLGIAVLGAITYGLTRSALDYEFARQLVKDGLHLLGVHPIFDQANSISMRDSATLVQ